MAAGNIIESFFVALGFQVDTKGLEEMRKKTDELRSSAMTIGALFTAAAGGIGLFVTGIAGAIDDLGDFADREDVAIEMVQELGHAAQLTGSSLEAVKTSISNVNKTVGEAVLGIGRGAMTFEKLGMSAKNTDGSVKTFDQILAEVADKMEGLSRQEQIAMAEKLGIDRSLIPLLRKGRDEIQKLREEAQAFGVVSADDAEKAGALADSLDRTKFMLSALSKMIAVGLMPQVTAVLDGFRNWMLANQKIIKSGLTSALKVVSALIEFTWDWVVRLVSGLKAAFDWLTQFKLVTYLAAAALTAFLAIKAYAFVTQLGHAIALLTMHMAKFNAAALIIPAIIGAVILAIGLLIDDYVNWKEGNDSVIGGLVEQFPWLLSAIQAIEQAVSGLVDFWVQQWQTLATPLMQLMSAVWELVKVVYSLLWPVVKMVFEGWAYIMAAIIPVIASVIAWIAENLVGAIATVINAATWLAEAFNTVFNGIKTGIDMVVSAFDWAKQNVAGFLDMVTGAISKVGSLLGLTGDASSVKLAMNSAGGSSTDAATANNSLNSTGGVIGSAGGTSNSTSTVTQTTQIIGTTIQVSSPDPAKAGEAVKQELDKMNKQTVRNGQSAVAL